MSMDAHDVRNQVMDGEPGDTPVYCHRCHGDGVVSVSFDYGEGQVDGEQECPICDGEGWVPKSEYEGDFPATRWP